MLTLTDPASVLKSLALLPPNSAPARKNSTVGGWPHYKASGREARALAGRFAETFTASRRRIRLFQTRPHMLVCAVHTGDLATLRDLVFPTLNVTTKTRADFKTHATCVRSRGALRAASAAGAPGAEG